MRPSMLIAAGLLVFNSTPYGQAPSSPFAPMQPGATWTYRLTFPESTRVPLDVEWVGMEGLIGTSVTHGMREVKAGSTEVTLGLGTLEGAGVATATVSRDLGLLFFGPAIREHRLQLAPKGKASVMLELHGLVEMKDPKAKPMELAQRIGALPADGKGTVEEDGWRTEMSAAPVTVPAGIYKDVVHSRISKPAAGNYTSAHRIDSWLAREVGLVKLVVSDDAGKVFYQLELSKFVKPQS